MTNDSLQFTDIAAANRQHDLEHGDPYRWPRVRSGWNDGQMMKLGKLTDRQIEKYQEAGYYAEELRLARRELAKKKAQRRTVRDGNFDLVDGRMIYRP